MTPEDEKAKALEYWNEYATKLTSYYAGVHSGVPFLVQSTIRKALAPAPVAGDLGQPPCGEQCPKDEDCGNFNFHGEGCSYNPKLTKEKIWEAITALSQSRFKFKTPMAADREGAGLLTKEQADLIDTCLTYAYHQAASSQQAREWTEIDFIEHMTSDVHFNDPAEKELDKGFWKSRFHQLVVRKVIKLKGE